MQPPPKIGNCKIFDNFCLAKKQAIRQQTIDIQNPALNTIAHLMVNIPFENKLTTITFFGKQCSMVQLEEKCCKGFLFSAYSIVSDSRKAYLLDKILFVHNIHAEILKAKYAS